MLRRQQEPGSQQLLCDCDIKGSRETELEGARDVGAAQVCPLFASLSWVGEMTVCLLTDGNGLAWGEQLIRS